MAVHYHKTHQNTSIHPKEELSQLPMSVTERETHREKDGDRHRDAGTERKGHIERGRETDRQTDRQTDIEIRSQRRGI